MHVCSIIPARGGSKGIPRKNVRSFLGEPLVLRTIRQSLACPAITRTVLTSEDAEILAVGRQGGAEVLPRPAELASDTANIDPVLLWAVGELERAHGRIDVVVLLYPTAPLRRVADIADTVARITDHGCDSALTLCEDSSYLWRVDGATAEPVNYDPRHRKPRQLEGWNQWVENKAVYAMKRDLLVNTRCRLGGRIGWVAMPALLSIDLDTPDDWAMAEAVGQRLG